MLAAAHVLCHPRADLVAKRGQFRRVLFEIEIHGALLFVSSTMLREESYITPAARSASTAAVSYPRRARISSVCAPSRGAARKKPGGVSDKSIGLPMSRVGPSLA